MKNKDLKYYKKLYYNIIVEREEEEGEVWFIAYTKELGKFSCYGKGTNELEAIQSFFEEKDNFIEFLFQQSKEIPEPESNLQPYDKYSGYFNVRTSRITHYKLAYQAKELDLSMNLYINQILSNAISIEEVESKCCDEIKSLSAKVDIHYNDLKRQLLYKTLEFENKPKQHPEPTIYKLAS